MSSYLSDRMLENMKRLARENPGYANKIKALNVTKHTMPNVFSTSFMGAQQKKNVVQPQRQSVRQATQKQQQQQQPGPFNSLGKVNSPLIGNNFTNTYQRIQNNQKRRNLYTQYQQQQQKYQQTPMLSAPPSPVLPDPYNTNKYGMNIDGGRKKMRRTTRKPRKLRKTTRKTRYSVKYV